MESGGFPESVLRPDSYVEKTPVADYHWASSAAYEAFKDMKFGVRVHWGIYSIWHRGAESWPYLPMSFEDRHAYNELYRTWNPSGFDAAAWMSDFKQSGLRFFTFTSKHHEGFCMFDTKTRVRSRVNYAAAGGPKLESCDLAYSIMETPFRRDVVRELCDAAHREDMKIDLYFSHPDWYDADFRPYVAHPLQIPSSAQWQTPNDVRFTQQRLGSHAIVVPDPTEAEERRLVARHRAQLLELLTNYGKIDMVCLDMWLGPRVWPEVRKTLQMIRKVQPDVMLRNRGIGNYGDYYTPERVVPGSATNSSSKPWFTIYPLGTDFSYDPVASNYKGTKWIVDNLADCVAKGGGFEVGLGPSAHGEFHPEAIRQMKAAGDWLKINGEAIYGTRPRAGSLWSEGQSIRYTRSKDNRFVYAILTEWPGREITFKSVQPKEHTNVTLLGTKQKISWKADRTAQTTTVTLPENLQQLSNRPCEHAWTLRFEAVE